MMDQLTKTKVTYRPDSSPWNGKLDGSGQYKLYLEIEAAFATLEELKEFLTQLPIPNSGMLGKDLKPEDIRVEGELNPFRYLKEGAVK